MDQAARGGQAVKVRLTLDVGDYERYVIAKYFGEASTEVKDRERYRATRKQVTRFTYAALRSAVRDQKERLRGRQRTIAQRLADGKAVGETLAPPRERQLALI